MYTDNNLTDATKPIKKSADIELLKKYAVSVNIAEELDDELLDKIASDVVKTAEIDDQTRSEWQDKYNEALKIAKQVIQAKTYPFDKASNVQIPLILEGCIQFNSRIMPELIQNNKMVHVDIIGSKSAEEEEESAQRVADHMNLQMMKVIDNWVCDTDKLLMQIALTGTIFRKFSYDPILRKPSVTLCSPLDVIIDNSSASVETAPRITHMLKMSKNDLIERMRYGIFKEIDLMPLKDEGVGNDVGQEEYDEEKQMPSAMRDTNYYYVLEEQHKWLDLDEDGYSEPYIVTVLKSAKKTLRIVARYKEEDFIFNSEKELIKINAEQYFASYIFLPSFDGTLLGLGFGQLLLQLNAAINTATNALIDSATLANIRGGFISRELRLQKGDMTFVPGEWKQVNSGLGQRISDSIFPLPIGEPSQTLFALLQFLVEFGKQIANISDILMGNPQSANMPVGSVVQLVEQGSKVFSSILTRLYESFRKEYNILFNLNKRYFPLYPESDLMTNSGFVKAEDYTNAKFNILPIANPALGVDAVRLAKMQALMQIAESSPFINKYAVLKRYLLILGFSDVDKIMYSEEELQKQPPSPQELLIQSEIEKNKADAAFTHMRIAEIPMKAEANILIEEQKNQIDAAYKGMQGAASKVDAIVKLAQAETAFKQAQIDQAAQFVEKEEAISTPKVDTSQIQQLTQMPQQGNNIQNNQQGVGNASPEQQSGIPNLPPELQQGLQEVALSQQQ